MRFVPVPNPPPSLSSSLFVAAVDNSRLRIFFSYVFFRDSGREEGETEREMPM